MFSETHSDIQGATNSLDNIVDALKNDPTKHEQALAMLARSNKLLAWFDENEEEFKAVEEYVQDYYYAEELKRREIKSRPLVIESPSRDVLKEAISLINALPHRLEVETVTTSNLVEPVSFYRKLVFSIKDETMFTVAFILTDIPDCKLDVNVSVIEDASYFDLILPIGELINKHNGMEGEKFDVLGRGMSDMPRILDVMADNLKLEIVGNQRG
jgi:hypothetical protein